ncbi:MAG: ATP-binding cassette domain-containing protein [Bacilli bacterium]|nr:ATP-binding cassette domain-containing protein [Bacilli bacterium]
MNNSDTSQESSILDINTDKNLNSNNDNFTITLIEENSIRNISLNKFRKKKILFGRGTNNDIVLNSLLVSPNHGFFEIINGKVKIVDNSSVNGIFVNDNKVVEAFLKDGDAIKIDNPIEPLSIGVIMIVTLGENVNEWQQFDMTSKDTITIGRNSSSDIVINHVSVPLNIANIYVQNNNFILVPSLSTNNILVNGKSISNSLLLKNRDVILIADAKLIFDNGHIYYQLYSRGVEIEAVDIMKTVRVKGKKKDISFHVSMSIKPGEFVAFVGGSGAGKTTFMNCISGVSKPTSGSVYINGNDLFKNYSVLKKIIGYVPQSDIVFDDLTLYDMLKYSANLRMPDDLSIKDREARIEEVLKIVELSDKKDVMIRSLSGGQRKRASIAVELLADPKLFFLDEPTSGLDPGTERNLMNILKKMTKMGKTIILVTHNTLNLHLCDKICFFGKGGKLCFMGTPSETLQFFNVSDFVDIYNLINDDVDSWYNKFNSINTFKKSSNQIVSKFYKNNKNKRSFFKQFITLSKRYIKTIVNDKQMLLLLLLQSPFIAYMFAIVAPDDMFEGYETTKMMLFSMTIAAIWLGTLNSIQVICKEKAILKREYMADLKLSAYFASKLVVQVIICAIQSFLFITVFIAAFGFVPDNGIITSWPLEMMFTFFLITVSSTCLGLLLSTLSKNTSNAVMLAPITLIPQLVLNGSFIELNGILEKISFFILDKWAIQLFGISCDLNSMPNEIQKLQPSFVRDIEDCFAFTSSHFWEDTRIVIIMAFVILIICYFTLKWQLESRK